MFILRPYMASSKGEDRYFKSRLTYYWIICIKKIFTYYLRNEEMFQDIVEQTNIGSETIMSSEQMDSHQQR